MYYTPKVNYVAKKKESTMLQASRFARSLIKGKGSSTYKARCINEHLDLPKKKLYKHLHLILMETGY